MRTRRKKGQGSHTLLAAKSAQAQFQSRPRVDTIHKLPETDSDAATLETHQEGAKRQGFNFGQIPIFAPIQTKLAVGAPGDKYEQQADLMAEQVVNSTQKPIQRQEGEDEEVQAKLDKPIQRQEGEDEEVQAKLDKPIQRQEGEDEEVQAKPVAGVNKVFQRFAQRDDQPKLNLAPTGSGKAMPKLLQMKMESAFNTDFSGVRIHEGAQAKSINALAYTRGSDIHFQPGKYQPESQSGQELLGHELTHVVQQRAGQVAAPQGKGTPINADRKLETEADVLGAKAARGEAVQVAGVTTGVQCQGMKANERSLTAKNDIYFKNRQQGQEVLAHEPTQAVQQGSSSLIQRKRSNLDPIPQEYVSKENELLKNDSILSGIFVTKTQKIQYQIEDYNRIDVTDTNYKKQEKILGKIMESSRKWLTEHQNLDSKKDKNKDKETLAKKVEAIVKVRSETVLEKALVEKQKSLMSNPDPQNEGGNVYSEKLLGSKKLAVATNVGAGAYGIAEGETLKATGKGIADQPFVLDIIDKIKSLFGIAKESAEDALKRTAGEAILGSAEWIKMALGKLALPVLMFPLAIKSFWDAKTDKQALSDRKDALEEKVKSGDLPEEEQQLLQDIIYGFNKVKRRFYSAIYGVVDAGIDLVSTVLAVLVPGFGTTVAAAVSLGKGVLNGLKTTLVKAKGLFKYFAGLRGKNRKESAERTINLARKGNKEALQLLVGLGFAKTTQDMHGQLEEQRTDKRSSFVKEVAEKLKSQA